MARSTLSVVAGIAALLACATFVPQAHGCSCLFTALEDVDCSNFDLVFVGTVVGKTLSPSSPLTFSPIQASPVQASPLQFAPIQASPIPFSPSPSSFFKTFDGKLTKCPRSFSKTRKKAMGKKSISVCSRGSGVHQGHQ